MAAHLTEEEQVEALKRWWKDHGTKTMAAIVIGLGGFFGWNQYVTYQEKAAAKRSEVFQQFVTTTTELEGEGGKDLSADQLQKAKTAAEHLVKEAQGNLYQEFGELYLAKLAVQANDYASAKVHLEKVIQSSSNAPIQFLAKLRLARVLAATGDKTAALSQLEGEVPAAFRAAFWELKGDLLISQQKYTDARAAYDSAKQAIEATDFMRLRYIQLKIENATTATDTPNILAPAQVLTEPQEKAQ